MFMMFPISEVHPFDDGNCRLARLMMNAELVSASQCRTIVTTHACEGYLDALCRLSQQSDPSLYIRMLSGAQQFVADLQPTSYESVKTQLEAQKAFTGGVLTATLVGQWDRINSKTLIKKLFVGVDINKYVMNTNFQPVLAPFP